LAHEDDLKRVCKHMRVIGKRFAAKATPHNCQGVAPAKRGGAK
jgi:hypothetical protein